MNQDIIERLQYSISDDVDSCPIPLPLLDSIHLINEYFQNPRTNKLCLVFPSKEYAAQWITVPIVLNNIFNDFQIHNEEIYESFGNYKPGDKLILNQSSIVEWERKSSNKITFRVKDKTGGYTYFSIGMSGAFKLQPAPKTRHKLSSLNRVKRDLPKKKKTPLDRILDIDSYGNKLFQKSSVCLISRYKDYEQSIDNVLLNRFGINEYFKGERISESGNVEEYSPLLIANNCSNLCQYLTDSTIISRIIIDGFNLVSPRVDFTDFDRKYNIPTVLITDLSEIEMFQDIQNHGFEFFNFSKENLRIDPIRDHSPFHSFNKRLRKYNDFSLTKEICNSPEIEELVRNVYSIEQDESNRDLNTLRINIFQLTNRMSRLAHIPSGVEISSITDKVNTVDSLFQRSKMWLGDSEQPVQESLTILNSIIESISSRPTEKFNRLESLVNSKPFDFIVCQSVGEANAFKEYANSLENHNYPEIISIAEVTDKLLSDNPLNAILLGWPKSNNMNRIVNSFLFNELTVLFYHFENKYHYSLQHRNRLCLDNINDSIDKNGEIVGKHSAKSTGFNEIYTDSEPDKTIIDNDFNIYDFELTLDSIQYSSYKVKGNLADSIKAKRIDFDYDHFLYSTESHKLLIINDFIENKGKHAKLYRKKTESLKIGDVIAFIHTERDVLVELVEKNTRPKDLASIKQWTELWKDLLKDYYLRTGNDFQKLVNDLRECGCSKHEATIRTWLQDETRIGPDDNADLISIAKMTESELLNDNIETVRESISKMIGLRMKASDYITNKIKSQIHQFADDSMINKQVAIEGLGSVYILKTTDISRAWENIDTRYVNRLLQKEII